MRLIFGRESEKKEKAKITLKLLHFNYNVRICIWCFLQHIFCIIKTESRSTESGEEQEEEEEEKRRRGGGEGYLADTHHIKLQAVMFLH